MQTVNFQNLQAAAAICEYGVYNGAVFFSAKNGISALNWLSFLVCTVKVDPFLFYLIFLVWRLKTKKKKDHEFSCNDAYCLVKSVTLAKCVSIYPRDRNLAMQMPHTYTCVQDQWKSFFAPGPKRKWIFFFSDLLGKIACKTLVHRGLYLNWQISLLNYICCLDQTL